MHYGDARPSFVRALILATVALAAAVTYYNVDAATYVQPLQCAATGIALDNPTTTATVTCPVTPPPTGCTAPPVIASSTPGITNFTRMIGTATVNYFSLGNRSVNITDYGSVYGQIPSVETWPGNSGITAVFQVPTNKYISLQFTVPPGYMAGSPANRSGYWYVNASSYSRAPISATVSTSCGDFSDPLGSVASTVVSGCYKNKAGGDKWLVVWENPAHVNPTCTLQDGRTYYLNIINADISGVVPKGGSAASTSKSTGSTCTTTCADPIANYIF